MNVTFSCKVLSRWAQLVSVFSRMFKFSRIVIYRAKSRRSGLKWRDLPIPLNRNNCSFSWRVQFFSNLGKHRSAVSNLCSARRENSCRERFSFSGRRNKHIFRAYPSTHKIAELCFEILQFIRSARLFRLTPPSRSRHRLCWRTPTSTHYWSSTLYTTFHREATLKTALELCRIKIRSQVQTITRAILPRNQSPSVSNSQRGRSCEQIFDSSTTFLNPLVGTNSLYGKRTVGFFSLASHALRACEARALRA